MSGLPIALALLGPDAAFAADVFVWGVNNTCTSPNNTNVAADALVASGRFASVGRSDLETVPNFSGVEVVFYFTAPCGEPGVDQALAGDALATFVDAGGSVVLLQFASDPDPMIGVRGRLMSGGYLPWAGGAPWSTSPGATLGSRDTSLLWTGITTLNTGGQNYASPVTVPAGSLLRGSWSDARPLAIQRSRVLFLNAYPGYGLGGDVSAFLGNAGVAMADEDRDGASGFDDCSDKNAAIRPAATEIAGDDFDQNCDGKELCYVDNDDDDYGSTTVTSVDLDCNDLNEGHKSGECNDASKAVRPGVAEVAGDDVDQNCDGQELCYTDVDDDDFGTTSITSSDKDCNDLNEGHKAVDCKDTDKTVFPGAVEVCDAVDQDCDGDVAESFPDLDLDKSPDCSDPDDDGDGSADGVDCAPLDKTVLPGATEACDAVDQDCDADLVDGFPDLDVDKSPDCVDPDDDGDNSLDAADCQPGNKLVFPGAFELCNSADDDCDTSIDEDAIDALAMYTDADNDGHGDESNPLNVCDPTGYASEGGDCDDTRDDVYPDAPEVYYDGVDGDCSGGSDYDADGDGFDAGPDCDDAAAGVNPDGVEINDGLDNDCDGFTEDDDRDEDGLTDGEETALGTDVGEPDSDGDGVIDGDEVGDPEDAQDTDEDGTIDALDDDDDGDGLPTIEDENPLDADSDDDGEEDGDEGVDDDDGDGLPNYLDDDDDGDGAAEADGDCDDHDPDLGPNTVELMNGVDDDCDGVIDDGFEDNDGDGFGLGDGDCDDADGDAFPGALEACDGVDNDCDGTPDDDACVVDEDEKGCATGGAGSAWLAAFGLLFARRRARR